ncbi:MAG: hypothetical protein M0R49_02240 [Limnochordia bacterium]|nr:hypothetical protein [Limnochordia bacterium]
MHPLSETLCAAQQSAKRSPCVEIKARYERFVWEKLYSGNEPPYYHSLVALADGALVRARITPPSEGRELFVQRVSSQYLPADFSNWQYLDKYNVLAVALSECSGVISLFYITSSRRIERIFSYDGGITWEGQEIIDYSPSTYINGIWASHDNAGNTALFFADLDTLYLKHQVGSVWQPRQSWVHQTGDLSDITGVYDGDFLLVVSGATYDGEPRLWRLVYGDDGNIPAGEWSPLKTLASAPANSGFSFNSVSLSSANGYNCFYNEAYEGVGSYNRTLLIKNSGSDFLGGCWEESEPFYESGEYGFSQVVRDQYLWLCSANNVYRANTRSSVLELSKYITSVKCLVEQYRGELVVELDNSDSRYAPLPKELKPGSLVEYNPGYITFAGREVITGLTFGIFKSEYVCGDGGCTLRLYCLDGWNQLASWRARHQLTWNVVQPETSISNIMAFILGRAGMSLACESASERAGVLCPYFSLNPGDDGLRAIKELLSFLPDYLRIEGNTAYLLDPANVSQSCYEYYGSSSLNSGQHPIFWGYYFDQSYPFNHYQVYGTSGDTGEEIIADAFDWVSIAETGERLKIIRDLRVTTLAEAKSTASLLLENSKKESAFGSICIPVNPGTQLWDIVKINDPCAGLFAHEARVIAVKTIYQPMYGKYEQELKLCKVEGGLT